MHGPKEFSIHGALVGGVDPLTTPFLSHPSFSAPRLSHAALSPPCAKGGGVLLGGEWLPKHSAIHSGGVQTPGRVPWLGRRLSDSLVQMCPRKGRSLGELLGGASRVASASLHPASPSFRMLCGSELLQTSPYIHCPSLVVAHSLSGSAESSFEVGATDQ